MEGCREYRAVTKEREGVYESVCVCERERESTCVYV